MSGLLVACKKNNDDQPGNPAAISDKVKKSTYDSGETIFSYDATGRIKSRTYLNGSKTEYSYEPGKVYEKQFNNAGVLTLSYTYELDANSLVGKENRSDLPGSQTVYLYNSDKQTVKSTLVGNGNSSSRDYFYSNGNCDSSRLSSNGNWNTTIKTTYYTDKLNVLDYEKYGETFWGKKSKNLIKSEQYFFSDGTMGSIENYSYEFDAKGRVIKRTSEADGDIDVTYFSYE